MTWVSCVWQWSLSHELEYSERSEGSCLVREVWKSYIHAQMAERTDAHMYRHTHTHTGGHTWVAFPKLIHMGEEEEEGKTYIHTNVPSEGPIYSVKEWTTSSSHFNSCFSITNEWQAHLSTAPKQQQQFKFHGKKERRLGRNTHT